MIGRCFVIDRFKVDHIINTEIIGGLRNYSYDKGGKHFEV